MPLKEIWNKVATSGSYRPARIAIKPGNTAKTHYITRSLCKDTNNILRWL